MTPDIALWILGASVAPLITWAVWHSYHAMTIRRNIDELLEMHRRPDDYGFGTEQCQTNLISQKTSIDDNTRALRELTHYMRWFAEHATQQTPPPPL